MEQGSFKFQHQGYLLKRMKIIGFKKYFVVLKEGHLYLYEDE